MKVLTAGMKPPSSSLLSNGSNIGGKKSSRGQQQQPPPPPPPQSADAATACDVAKANSTNNNNNDNAAGAADNDNDATNNPLLVPFDDNIQSQQQQQQQQLDDLYYTSSPPILQNSVELLVAEETEKYYAQQKSSKSTEYLWLAICFFGIMGSFVAYGLLLEYATSGDKQLHELSFLFITSLLYTLTASVGRYARAEKPSTIPPAQFAVLGLTSMGSTFFSVRALRYVIYPIQVLAKSCKPVPVMLMGALMGKKYPMKKYLKVALIVAGVGLFMGGG